MKITTQRMADSRLTRPPRGSPGAWLLWYRVCSYCQARLQETLFLKTLPCSSVISAPGWNSRDQGARPGANNVITFPGTSLGLSCKWRINIKVDIFSNCSFFCLKIRCYLDYKISKHITCYFSPTRVLLLHTLGSARLPGSVSNVIRLSHKKKAEIWNSPMSEKETASERIKQTKIYIPSNQPTFFFLKKNPASHGFAENFTK